MKPKLLILSDLWGEEKSDWVAYYIKQLQNTFRIQYYDCCTLGALDTSIYTEENLHQQFINGGIEIAVQNLLLLEKESVSILAFSIGGLIAWKSALKGLDINILYAISSTRLRYETNKPKNKVELYFGENDSYKPTSKWFNSMNIPTTIIPQKKHDIYTNPEFAMQLSIKIYTSVSL
ncbi:hypothetical protein [Aquimarina longa]|uniref:hypothetical protein n=1 Tax=Aquimarina longa TaxID=1080221 RepID=UPI0007818C3A|nr:hypothetical protein [Aquimarina longa]